MVKVAERNKVMLESWSWLRDRGLEIVKAQELEVTLCNKRMIQKLRKEIEEPAKEKEVLNYVRGHREWLEAHYSLDRLQWLVDFSELIFDTEGTPVRMRKPPMGWWGLYLTIRGKPENEAVLFGLNWYWILRKHFREADKSYVDKICREFFAKHPKAAEEVGSLGIPSEFIEINQEVSPDELYSYWKRVICPHLIGLSLVTP